MGLTLIFFVTSRCNARYDTCFYWQDLNQPGDLSFDEIATLSRTGVLMSASFTTASSRVGGSSSMTSLSGRKWCSPSAEARRVVVGFLE